MINLVWKVDPPPVGKYRGFETRAWPSANFKGTERCAAHITCVQEYVPRLIKEAKHPELTVLVALYTEKSFVWRRIVKRAATLQEAKQLAWVFWNNEKYKQYLPKELQ